MSIDKQLADIKNSLVRMEDKYDNKIAALFDAHAVSQDAIRRLEKKLNTFELRLDSFEQRLYSLEHSAQ